MFQFLNASIGQFLDTTGASAELRGVVLGKFYVRVILVPILDSVREMPQAYTVGDVSLTGRSRRSDSRAAAPVL